MLFHLVTSKIKQKWTFLLIRPICYRSNVPEFYHRLELPTSATTEEIKSSYYRLSKLYHPDICADSDATAKFEKISEAYECLSDQQLRIEYDRKHKVNSPTNLSTSSPLEDEEFIKYATFKRRCPTMRGKTSHFDYSEHYRSHYGHCDYDPFKTKSKNANTDGDRFLRELTLRRRIYFRIQLSFSLLFGALIVFEILRRKH